MTDTVPNVDALIAEYDEGYPNSPPKKQEEWREYAGHLCSALRTQQLKIDRLKPLGVGISETAAVDAFAEQESDIAALTTKLEQAEQYITSEKALTARQHGELTELRTEAVNLKAELAQHQWHRCGDELPEKNKEVEWFLVAPDHHWHSVHEFSGSVSEYATHWRYSTPPTPEDEG